VWFGASSFSFQYPVFSLRLSSSCVHGLHLPAISILSSIFPSIMCFRRQFLCKMWPIELAFLLIIVCRIFRSSLTLCNTSFFSHDGPTDSLHLSPVPHFKTFQVFLIYFLKCPIFCTILQNAHCTTWPYSVFKMLHLLFQCSWCSVYYHHIY